MKFQVVEKERKKNPNLNKYSIDKNTKLLFNKKQIVFVFPKQIISNRKIFDDSKLAAFVNVSIICEQKSYETLETIC